MYCINMKSGIYQHVFYAVVLFLLYMILGDLHMTMISRNMLSH